MVEVTLFRVVNMGITTYGWRVPKKVTEVALMLFQPVE